MPLNLRCPFVEAEEEEVEEKEEEEELIPTL